MKSILITVALLISSAWGRTPTYTEGRQGYFALTIASGATVSDSIDMRKYVITGFSIPVLTAANLTVQVSLDDSTWVDLYDDLGVEVTIQTGSGASARTIRVSPGDWYGIIYFRLRSGTSGTPVTQGATRTINVLFR